MFVNRKALLTKACSVPASLVCFRGGAKRSLKTNKRENRGLTIISEKRKGPPTEAYLPLEEQTEGRLPLTRPHKAPQGPTRAHEAPRGPTRAHEASRGPRKGPRGAMRAHEAPRGPTRAHEAPRGPLGCCPAGARGSGRLPRPLPGGSYEGFCFVCLIFLD